MAIHELKTTQPYYDDILYGKKTFEIRKNDRNFKVGDILELREYDSETDFFPGNYIYVIIVYILNGGQFGISKDYCVMGIAQIGSTTE